MEFDRTKASSARIYDYLLGGEHNFEADRLVAEQIAETMPYMAQAARLNRAFLGAAAQQLAEADFSCYIDLATGLPTEGALHEFVPKSAKILYNDVDPEAVAYGRQIVRDWPNICYVQANIRNIDRVLAAAEAFFGLERRVGLCLVFTAHFLDDAALEDIFRRLHDWAAPGSQLVVSSIDYKADNEAARQTAQMYQQRTGLMGYARAAPRILELAAPWQPYKEGLRPLEDYIEAVMGTTVTYSARRGKLGYGGLLIRR